MTSEAATERAATWMRDQVQRHGALYQDQAAGEIVSRFGDGCVAVNDNGNLAISRVVLKRFRELTAETIVWDRSERAWRGRTRLDGPGRLADS